MQICRRKFNILRFQPNKGNIGCFLKNIRYAQACGNSRVLRWKIGEKCLKKRLFVCFFAFSLMEWTILMKKVIAKATFKLFLQKTYNRVFALVL